MDEAISHRDWTLVGSNAPKVAGQIEMPLPPDPILRRPCADREEKRVTYGRDIRSNKQLAAGRPRQNGHAEGQCLVGENMLSNAKNPSPPCARQQADTIAEAIAAVT